MSIEGRKDNRSFNIPNGKTAFGTTIPVKGNGICIAFTDGISDGGMYSQLNSLFRQDSVIGVPNGSESAGYSPLRAAVALGLTTDASKSGIIADISGGVAVIIKY